MTDSTLNVPVRRSGRRTTDVRTRWSAPAAVSAGIAIGLVALATRVLASRPNWSVGTVTALAGLTLVFGARAVLAQHNRRWRVGWSLFGAALLVAAGGQVVATHASGAASSVSAQWLAVGASVLVLLGTAVLVRHRAAGQASGFLLEALVVATWFGFAVWSLTPTGRTAGLTGVLRAGLDAGCVWPALRLSFMGPDRPPAMRFLVCTLACRPALDALVLGSALTHHLLAGMQVTAVGLWPFCLALATASHPSLRHPFEVVRGRDRTRLPVGAVLLVGCIFTVPAVVYLRHLLQVPASIEVVVVGATVLPLTIVLYLSHQVYARARAEYRAQHDPLTGLPNRNLFEDQLQLALTQHARNGESFCVMFLDLDRFKTINDSLGHAAGNQLLVSVAQRLRSCVREHDTVARLGGDEFTLLVFDVTTDASCARVAQKVLDAFTEPFVAGGREVFTSTSIGIAVYPSNGGDIESLVKHADTAMYRAKARGRNSYEFYTSDMSARTSVKMSLEHSLRNTLEQGELFLNYQPEVDAATGELVRLEALARWTHPKLGPISPYAFIPLAEESGLILPLDEWAITAACQQLREWMDADLPVVPVAVNVSAQQLADRNVDELVEDILTAADVPGRLLELEVTESVLVHDVAKVGRVLQRLRNLGVRISIDDFGTGYSGLSYLAQMPLDRLKIDRSFVEQVDTTEVGPAVVSAIVVLANGLGLTVIAEGVETPGQANLLREHGCHQMQGYLFSPPLPADRIPALLARKRFIDPAAARRAEAAEPMDVLAAPTDPRVSELLAAVCRSEDAAHLDPDLLAEVLAALQPSSGLLPRSLRARSARLAVGTFAGLLPLSGGVAAAGVLPPALQHAAAAVFADVGIPVPDGAAPTGRRPHPPRDVPVPGHAAARHTPFVPTPRRPVDVPPPTPGGQSTAQAKT